MTLITGLYKNDELIGFKVDGHAKYSIPGRDIVCAAISMLTINTINSIRELSTAELEMRESSDGNIQYCLISKPDIIAATLLKAASIGYKSIAEQYTDNVSYKDGGEKMDFSSAYIYLKRGHKIKLPEWGGYWFWDSDKKTIIMHCRDGKELDIRETEDVDYTMSFICRKDWQLAD